MEPVKDYRFTVEIDADPVPKGRPRFYCGPNGKPRTYTPKNTRVYEDLIQDTLAIQKPDEPFIGPLAVRIVFYINRPKSVKRSQREFPHVKPDIDNLVKAVCDCANGVIWNDDAQITDLHAIKRYADDVKHRVILSVEPMQGLPDEKE